MTNDTPIQSPILILVQAHTTAENVDAARDLIRSFVAPTRAEEGCLQYELLTDLDEANHIVLLEEWATPEALQAHNSSPVYTKLMTALMPLLEGGGSGMRLTRN